MSSFVEGVIGTTCAIGVMTLTLTVGTLSAQDKGVAAGLYLDKCSVCHGADGAGKTAKGRKLKLKDVRQTSLTLTAEQMIEIVSKGKAPDMDGFSKELSAAQIKEIVSYYRGLAAK